MRGSPDGEGAEGGRSNQTVKAARGRPLLGAALLGIAFLVLLLVPAAAAAPEDVFVKIGADGPSTGDEAPPKEASPEDRAREEDDADAREGARDAQPEAPDDDPSGNESRDGQGGASNDEVPVPPGPPAEKLGRSPSRENLFNHTSEPPVPDLLPEMCLPTTDPCSPPPPEERGRQGSGDPGPGDAPAEREPTGASGTDSGPQGGAAQTTVETESPVRLQLPRGTTETVTTSGLVAILWTLFVASPRPLHRTVTMRERADDSNGTTAREDDPEQRLTTLRPASGSSGDRHGRN